MKNITAIVRLFSILAMSVLVACSAGSRVSSQGTTNNVVWPAVDRVTFDNGQGTFPSLDHLALITEGMTKDQLYHLLGRPHFDEGFFAVREWDYLFHFHTPGMGKNGVSTCQFKVLYDRDMLTRDRYWRAVEPADGLCPPGVMQRRLSLSADALFAFDSSELKDKKGIAELDALAVAIKQTGMIKQITILGYTDYLGSKRYNQLLSQARAQTVRDYLIAKGIAAQMITATGRGDADPVVKCEGSGSRAALIECLQPNRRIELRLE